MRVVVLCALAACAREPANGERCVAAGDHITLVAGRTTSAPMLRGVVIDRCTEDAWSNEAIECVIAAGSHEELVACRDKLGDGAQVLAIVAEMRKAKPVRIERDQLPVGFDPNARSLVIELGEADIVVGGKALTGRELDAVFRAAFARDRQCQVLVKARKGTSHGRVVEVLDRAKAAGLTRLAIASR